MVVFCFDCVFLTLLGDLNPNGAKVSQNVGLCEKKGKKKVILWVAPMKELHGKKYNNRKRNLCFYHKLPPFFLSFCLAISLFFYLFHHQQAQSGNGHNKPSPQPLLKA